MPEINLRTSNEILAILSFLIVCYTGVWIIVKKRLKQERIKNRFYQDVVGSAHNIIDKIKAANAQMGYLEKIEKELKQARSSISVQGYIVIMVVSVVVITMLAYKILGMFLIALPIGLTGILVPRLIVKSQSRKFKENFDVEMVKALRRMAAVLRAGGSLENALQDVVDAATIPDFVRQEFKKVLVTYKGGFSIVEAFYGLYDSVGSPDTLYLCVAIDVQMETGGDKAEIFDSIANTISNRNIKNKHVKAKLAEVNVSTNVLTLAPIPFAVAIYIYNPQHFDFFKASMQGRIIGFFIIAFMIAGFFIVKRFSRIDY